MKSITVKNDGSTSVYSSPFGTASHNIKTGESIEIVLTEDEELQSCYQSLISDIKRQEFEKKIIFLLGNHFNGIENWTDVSVKISFSENKRAELNIRNRDNLQFENMEISQIQSQ